jgi:ketosteroid isomerase-like protein
VNNGTADLTCVVQACGVHLQRCRRVSTGGAGQHLGKAVFRLLHEDVDMDAEQRLDVVESELAIRRLAFEYCHGADKRDLARFVAVWAPDAVWSPADGIEARGLESISQVVQVQWRAFARYVHWTTNHVVAVSGDEAQGECDVAVAVLLNNGRWYSSGGTYFDRYVRIDGRWFIGRREARGDFDLSVPPDDDEVDIDMEAESAAFLTILEFPS